MLNLGLAVAVGIAIVALSFEWLYAKPLAFAAFFVFLLNATSTGADYDYYRIGFEKLGFIDSFPFVSVPGLDAEPLYRLFMGLGSLVTSDFNVFLAFSFALFIVMCWWAGARLGLKPDSRRLVLLASFPAVIPVICYWSPRSAISLPLIVLSYVQMRRKSYVRGALLAFVATLFHSQYIPFIAVMLASVVISEVGGLGLLGVGLLGTALLLSALRFGPDAIAAIPGLERSPLFAFAIYKLHYFSDSYTDAVRVSGIILILLDLAYLVRFRSALVTDRGLARTGMTRERMTFVRDLLDLSAVFSLVTNVIFMSDSHLSGRVGRFSDYFLMCVGLPLVSRSLLGRRAGGAFVTVYALLALVMYRSIYFSYSN